MSWPKNSILGAQFEQFKESRKAMSDEKVREFNLEFSDLCYDDFDCKVTVDKGTDAKDFELFKTKAGKIILKNIGLFCEKQEAT